MYTKPLTYNVYGYTAYAKSDNRLPLNRTLYNCELINEDKLTTRGVITLVKKNVFAPIAP